MIFLFGYFLALLVVLRRAKAPLVRFDFVATAVWLFAVTIGFLPAIEYGSGLALTTVILVISGHSALIFGFLLTTTRNRSPLAYSGGVTTASVVLAASAAFFVLMTFLGDVIRGQIPLVGSLSGLANRRNSFLDGQLEQSMSELVAGWARYPALLFVCLIPLFIKRQEKTLAIVGLLTLISLADYSFGIGQRATLVFALLSILVSFLVIYRPGITQGLLVALVLLPVVYWFGSSFYLARSSNFADNPDAFLAFNCAGAEFGSLVEDRSVNVKAFTLSSCYFSSPIHNLDQFVSDNENSWDHTWGKYNLGVLFVGEFEEERDKIEKYYNRQNHAPNPWATGLRDFWLDFREFSFVPLFLAGAGLGTQQRRKRLVNEFQLARTSLLALTGFLVPFLSPLIIRAIVYPVIVSFVFELIAKMLADKKPLTTPVLSTTNREARNP